MACEDCRYWFYSETQERLICWALRRKDGSISTFRSFKEMNSHARDNCDEPEADSEDKP